LFRCFDHIIGNLKITIATRSRPASWSAEPNNAGMS
jgi:hypothetical protein